MSRVTQSTTRPAHAHRSMRPTKAVGIAGGILVSATLAVIAAAQSGESRQQAALPSSTTSASPDGVSVGDRWLLALQRLDGLRAEAWITGDPTDLKRVYIPGSAVLRADRRMLSTYLSRGLRTDGVRLEFAAVRVLDRRAGEVELAVVDRLGPVQVHTDIGGAASLPADQPTAHRIVLRRLGGRWLIADVTTQ